MKQIDKTRPILTELVIGMLFFLVCAALLLRLFGASYGLVRETGFRNEALNACSDVIDTLFSADDPEAALRELGFDETGILVTEDYQLRIEAEAKPLAGCRLFSGTLTAGSAEEDWFSLPVSVCCEVRS